MPVSVIMKVNKDGTFSPYTGRLDAEEEVNQECKNCGQEEDRQKGAEVMQMECGACTVERASPPEPFEGNILKSLKFKIGRAHV
jgi:hypothetical protein